MRYLLLLTLLFVTPLSAELTAKDKENISYIINTLSGKSAVSLIFYQSKLESVGKETAKIQPLIFLGYLYSNQTLREKIPAIAPIVWNRFKKDFIKSLNKASIKEDAAENFASQTGLPQDEVAPLIENKEWNALFTLLFDSKK